MELFTEASTPGFQEPGALMLRGASTGETEGPGPMLGSAGEKPEAFCT